MDSVGRAFTLTTSGKTTAGKFAAPLRAAFENAADIGFALMLLGICATIMIATESQPFIS
jgi:hypothetical protein